MSLERWGHWILDPQLPHVCGRPPAPWPREPHLGREVDAGSAVEEQLGYVEVLVMSCDVEGGESRLGTIEDKQHCTTVCCHFYLGSAQALKSWQDQRTPQVGRFGPKGSSDIPRQVTSKSEVLPLGGTQSLGSCGQTTDQGHLQPFRQGPIL